MKNKLNFLRDEVAIYWQKTTLLTFGVKITIVYLLNY